MKFLAILALPLVVSACITGLPYHRFGQSEVADQAYMAQYAPRQGASYMPRPYAPPVAQQPVNLTPQPYAPTPPGYVEPKCVSSVPLPGCILADSPEGRAWAAKGPPGLTPAQLAEATQRASPPDPVPPLAEDDGHSSRLSDQDSFEAMKERYKKVDPYVVEQFEEKRSTTLDLIEKVYWASACKVIDPLTASYIADGKLGNAYMMSLGRLGVIGLHNADRTLIPDINKAKREGLQRTDCQVWHDNPELVQAMRSMAQ